MKLWVRVPQLRLTLTAIRILLHSPDHHTLPSSYSCSEFEFHMELGNMSLSAKEA
jgi:hypothetical protein